MKRLMIYLKDYKKESVLAPLFKLLEAFFELLVPLVMANIIDRGIADKDMGYIVYGPVGEYVFRATSRESDMPTILRGNSSDYPIPATNINCYVLANKTWGIGFYKFNGTELKAKRAWLPASKVSSDVQQGLSSGVKSIRFTFPEGTGIDDIIYNINNTDSDATYDLSGQQLPEIPNSGLYIQKGKGKIFKKR